MTAPRTLDRLLVILTFVFPAAIGCDADHAATDAAAMPDVVAPGPAEAGADAARGTCAATTRRDLAPGAVQAASCMPVQVDRDIAYAPGPPGDDGVDGPFRLDLYRPSGTSPPFRTLIWIHGGGWQSGDEDQVNQAIRAACAGWAVAAVDYRLTSEGVTFPTPLSDVKAAIRFLRANAATYQLDPARFVAFGSSAGGHLASLVGTSAGVAELEDLSLGNPTVSSAVAGVVDWYGPVDLPQMDTQLAAVPGCGAGNHSAATSPESALLGCTVGDPACAPAAARANPVTYIDGNEPPFLIMHGTSDCNVAIGQSTELAAALRGGGVCVEDYAVTGAAHGGPEWTTDATQAVLVEYLNRMFPP